MSVYKSHLDIFLHVTYSVFFINNIYLFVSPLQSNSIICSFIKQIVYTLQQMEK